MIGTTSISAFAVNRLNGELVPADLELLLPHNDELFELTGIRLQSQKEWAPWLDTSYLTAQELTDPDLTAHWLATSKVCSMIAFVAAEEHGQYLGYWRGPQKRPIFTSPIVVLDGERQFGVCPGSCFAEALLSRVSGEELFLELREFLRALGLPFSHRTPDDIPYLDVKPTPDALQNEFYVYYRTMSVPGQGTDTV
jgi:hypothetical protein